MSTFEEYNVLLESLGVDVKYLSKDASSFKLKLVQTEQNLNIAQRDASKQINSFLQQITSDTGEVNPNTDQDKKQGNDEAKDASDQPRGEEQPVPRSVLNAFKTFQHELESTKLSVISAKKMEKMITDRDDMVKQSKVIKRQLDVLCNDIDQWLASTMKKPRLPFRQHSGLRNKKARDIHIVSWMDEKLPDVERELAELDKDAKAVRKAYTALVGSYPDHLVSVVKSIVALLEAHQQSVNHLHEHRQWLNSSDIKIPESHEDWLNMLTSELKERELHVAPNLPLSASELRRFTINLFDEEMDRRRHVLHRIKQEQGAIDSLMNTHSMDHKLHHFNFGYEGAKKEKPSRKIRQILDAELKSGKASRKETNLLVRVEQQEQRVRDGFEHLINQAKPTVRRHFKEDFFSVLFITSQGIKPSDYVGPYKKSWHLYPNYHLCLETVKTTSMKQREVDALLKRPLRSKLCAACLDGTLTQDQAMILQDIDVHNDLFTMFTSHDVPLDLVFALHAQEGQGWLGALLESPKLHAEIAEHRHDPFDERLWNLVVQKALKPWHYACIVRLHFSEDHALETLLLGEDVWGELNEFAGLYDVEEELRQLVEIYKPKNDKASLASAPLSLSDVMKTLEPIADFTVDKASTTSKKVRRRKKGRHTF